MTIASFLFFTGLVAVITYFATRKDNHDSSTGYFLAGRQLGGLVIAGSLLLTNLSTEQLVGLNGSAYIDGLSVMAWEVVAVVALVAMALFFLPRYLRSGITTLPQLLENRFDHGTHTLVSLIFLFAYAVILLPIILYTGARGLSEIVDLRSLLGIESDLLLIAITVVIVGLIGSAYALWGGLRTVAVSDTLNGIMLLIGGIMIVLFGLAKVGGGEGVMAGIMNISESDPERLNSIGGPKQSVPFGTLFTGVMIVNMFYWTTNQQIIQRTFGARNLREGQKGVLLCGALKLLGPLYLVLPGIIAYHLYSGNADMKPDMAYGTLVRDVLPRPLAGFFLAAMVGAILSSFNSALNSACTLFSVGIYKNVFRPNATEHQVVRSGKWFGFALAVAAMSVAPMLIGQESIFSYLQKMNGLYFIPIFAVALVGLLTRRVPAVAAKAALIAGLVTISLGYFVPIGTKQVPVEPQAADIAAIETGTEAADVVASAPAALPTTTAPAEAVKTKTVRTYLGGDVLNEYHFLGIVFAGLVLLMLVIGAVRPMSEPWTQEHSGDVDITPWKGSWVVGIVLLILVVTIYALFADFSILSQ